MILFQKMINQKMNTITEKELLQYADDFNIAFNKNKAKEVVKLVKGQKIDLFKTEERRELLKKIASVTDQETAKQVNQLFNNFIK
ncbi:DUF2624 domain-containing protein [Bacillus carboniphilus]|uniref:DUF2624 domain-containing protein n=1 Tax=Bacillus carboniphilus TaxID=86663 RepID=A0ABY9JZV1_9BACI|nr:DUF2624 domain-containing protein [Bacillus carboniphilus]WLR43965.1 DUF2624 domain-containing protein [Bacillus carboniphilus]